MLEENIKILEKNYPKFNESIKLLLNTSIEEIRIAYSSNSNSIHIESDLQIDLENFINTFLLTKSSDSKIISIRKAIKNYLKMKLDSMLYDYKDIVEDCNFISESLASQVSKNTIVHIEKSIMFFDVSNKNERKINYWKSLEKSHVVSVSLLYKYIEHALKSIKWVFSCFLIDTKYLEVLNINNKSKVKSIVVDLGDLHFYGKTVAKIVTADSTVILKPRNGKLELLLQEIVDICKKHNKQFNLGIPKVIYKTDYSWHEFIEFEEHKEVDDVYSYYYNIGSLITLMFALKGIDFHYENIIAKKNVPYLVDIECLFTNNKKSENTLGYTVLNSYITPPLVGNKADKYICGIGLRSQEEKLVPSRFYSKNSNGNLIITDKLEEIPNYKNRPLFENDEIDNEKIKENILKGFKDSYDLIISKDISEKIIEVIKKDQVAETRILNRPTQKYAEILSLASHPRFTMNLHDRKMMLACAIYDKTIGLDIMIKEFDELYNGRIPYFNSPIEQKNILELTHQMEGMKNIEEFELQHMILRTSIERLFPRKNNKDFFDGKHSIDELNKLLNQLLDQKLSYKGTTILLNSENFKDSAKYLKVMDNSLYSGIGSMLFLKICCHILEKDDKSLKQEVINLYSQIFDIEVKKVDVVKYGVFEGMGSLLYLSYLMSKYIESINYEKKFFIVLEKILNKLNSQEDYPMDIINGISGILIVCCRMYQMNSEEKLLYSIKLLTEKIIKGRKYKNNDSITWEREYTGFAHGNSGILYSLVLSNELIDLENLEDIIVKGIKFENDNKISMGWKDLRYKNSESDFNSWCHGAFGIVIARKAMLEEGNKLGLSTRKIIKSDILYYSDTSHLRKTNNHPSLCHGIYGEMLYNNDKDKLLELLKYNALDIKDISEDKSIMTGKLGLYYAYLICEDKTIPNILLLK